MNLSQNTQAILLLTGYFNPSSSSEVKPLTVGEWARFAEFLKGKSIAPSRLLEIDCLQLLEGYTDKSISLERIDALLKRGTAMAVALEKWSRANVWVISRADHEYPERLKKKLGHNSPPILYGCGNKALLNSGGVGVVGSRNVSAEDLAYTKDLGAKAANTGFSVVSGGAKGVDQAAMLAALEVEGTVIGILADSLLRASSSRQYRQHLVNNNLVLITPFYPEAGFNAGNAMQRNKYIYCLSDATVVVHSGNPEFGKNGKGGGTWTGALENIKKAWVPLWVKQTDDKKAGNALIVKEGAYWLPEKIEEVDIESLFEAPEGNLQSMPEDIFSQAQDVEEVEQIEEKQAEESQIENSATENDKAESEEDIETVDAPKEKESVEAEITLPESFYEYFLLKVKPVLAEAKTVDELVELLELNKTQLNAWLKQAVEDKRITKLNKPVRYEWNEANNKQGSLL
jgi:predicted Rossmann fold nucleotide-binding protein DprA/Smf involved in DNA uptake